MKKVLVDMTGYNFQLSKDGPMLILTFSKVRKKAKDPIRYAKLELHEDDIKAFTDKATYGIMNGLGEIIQKLNKENE